MYISALLAPISALLAPQESQSVQYIDDVDYDEEALLEAGDL